PRWKFAAELTLSMGLRQLAPAPSQTVLRIPGFAPDHLEHTDMPLELAVPSSDEQGDLARRTLTVEQAAKYLSVSKSYLNKLRCTGATDLPFHTLGSRVRSSVADLDAYLVRNRRRSTSDCAGG